VLYRSYQPAAEQEAFQHFFHGQMMAGVVLLQYLRLFGDRHCQSAHHIVFIVYFIRAPFAGAFYTADIRRFRMRHTQSFQPGHFRPENTACHWRMARPEPLIHGD